MNDSPAPIFVVGTARSGTTLLAARLAAHPRLDCGHETHFFNKTRRDQRRRAVRDRHWPEQAVELVTRLKLNGHPVHELFQMRTEDIAEDLAKRLPSEGAMLETLTARHAAVRAKSRWIEKTPNHLMHVHQIRAVFPNACIVRIVRDPRAVAVSRSQLPWSSDSFLVNAYAWLLEDTASRHFFARDRRSLTLRYEDLVREPEEQMQRVFQFVGESYDRGAAGRVEDARALIEPGAHWKEKATQPIDATRAGAWESELPADARRAIELVCREAMLSHGYESTPAARRTMHLDPFTFDWVERNEPDVLASARHGDRVLPSVLHPLWRPWRRGEEVLRDRAALRRRPRHNRVMRQARFALSRLAGARVLDVT